LGRRPLVVVTLWTLLEKDMPILDKEVNLWPDDLLEGASQPEGKWTVLQVRARQEKTLARALRVAQIPFYLPTVLRAGETRKGRAHKAYVPLFDGFVFARYGEEQHLTVVRTGRVAGLIAVVDQEKLAQELLFLQRAIAAEEGVFLTPHGLIRLGTTVQIESGCLKGLCGKVVKIRQRKCLVIVSILGQSAVVDISAMTIKPVVA